MKTGLSVQIIAIILLVIFGGIVIHAPLSVWLGTLLPADELAIKSWKEVLLLLSTPFAVLIIHRHRMWRDLARDKIMQVAGLYVLLHIVIASALLRGPIATLAGLAIDLRYIIYFLFVYILLKAAPTYRRRFIQVAAVGAVIVVGFAVLQLFLPADILKYIGYGKDTIQPYLTVDQNPDFVRVNSTLRGPNPLGAYAVIVLGVLTAAIVRGRLILSDRMTMLQASALAAMSSIALWISYSRSALAAAGVTVFLTVILALRHLISRRIWIAGAIILFALAGGLLLGRESSFVAHILFHENPAEGNAVNSNEGHVESLISGTERMLRQPIGGGIGSTGSASLMTDSPLVIENQYLFIAHEAGWLGLGLFIGLLSLIFIRLWRYRQDWLALGVLTSGIGLSLIGLLLPVWVDDTVSIIWWGLAAVALASGGINAKKSKQKTA